MTSEFVAIYCGDRHWKDRTPIHEKVREDMRAGMVLLIEGECPAGGADIIASDVALHIPVPVLAMPANWMRYGRGAGPIRNAQQLDWARLISLALIGNIEWQQHVKVRAFHTDLSKSKGTADMVRRAREAGLDVELYDGENWTVLEGLHD